MIPTLYLRCKPSDIAPRVLLTGDPARVHRIADALDDARIVNQNREYTVATGRHREVPITAVSAGIGAPSTAIAIEELAQLGARVIIRVGTMMSIDTNKAPMGSAFVATGSARFEGTSAAYLPPAYPAVPHWGLAHHLILKATWHKLKVVSGLTATYDAFYPAMAPSLVGRGNLDLEALRRGGILALDMETALVHIMGTAFGIATAALCLVTVQAEPFTALENETRAELEDRLIAAALDGLIGFDS